MRSRAVWGVAGMVACLWACAVDPQSVEPQNAAAPVSEGSNAPVSAGSNAPTPPAPMRAAPKKVDLSDLLATRVAKNAGRGGGTLRAATAGGVIFEGAAGSIDQTSGKAMTTDTLFEIASVSKTFTAATVLALVEDGKLALDAPISTMVPATVTNGLLRINGVELAGTATLRQLLSHTSGLPDYWLDGPFDTKQENPFTRAFNKNVNRFWQPLEVLALARELTPIHAPGGAHHYGDTGYVLLGLAIEKAEGKPLQDVYRSRLYAPLGMTTTYFAYREQPPPNAALSHRFEGQLDLHGRTNQTADWAGGGLVSTAQDLERFMLGVAEGKLFKHAGTLALMRTLVPTEQAEVEYGLGVYHFAIGAAGTVFGHDGWGNVFMYYWPERQIVFTGTLNQHEGNDFFPMIDAAARRIDETANVR